MEYVYAPPEPPALIDYSGGWAQGFFLLPTVFAVLLTCGLLIVRRTVFAVALNWAWSWPTGFGLWLLFWYGVGPATGTPPTAIIWMAAVGWLFFWLGMLHAARRGEPSTGLVVSAAALVALLAYRFLHPEDAGLITLALAGIALGVAVVVCALVVRATTNKVATKAKAILPPGKLATT